MADLTHRQAAGFTKLTNEDEDKTVDVVTDVDDIERLAVDVIGSIKPGAIAKLYVQNAVYSSSKNLLVDGSSAPVVFNIPISSTNDIYIQELRFYANGSGIKFGQFFAKNIILTNGIKVEIKSNDQTTILPLLKVTEDFKNKFAFGSGANFRIDVQSGADGCLAVFIFDRPTILKKIGTFGTDDYIKVTIQDNITAGNSLFEFLAKGYEE